MRLKNLSWFLLSLLLFLAAFYFWRLGNERERQQSPATNAVTALLQFTNYSAATTTVPTNLLATDTINVPSPRQPFPYRLSNTAQSIGELTRNETAVLLANALLDTRLAARPEIPAHLRAQGDPESYIVQSRGYLDDAFRKALTAAGATIISYVPNNAYLVRVSADGAKQLAALRQTQAVLPFEPYYKFDQQLLAMAVQKRLLPDDSRLNVLLFAGQRDRAVAAFATMGAEVLAEERTPFGPQLVVQTRADSLAILARHPAVQGLALHRERRPANDLTRVRLSVSTNTTTAAPAGNFRGLTGDGVLVNVNDTGIYADHPDLTAARVTGLTVDLDGHGTHVAGTIAGSGLKSGTVTMASGSTNGANFRGLASSAKIFSQPIAGGILTDEALQAGAARTNAHISNNSWSYGLNEYDIHAASYDAAVRDALPGVAGSQPLTMVFSIGNSGGGNGAGLGGIPGSVESPATAKNVISVGATELLRNITNDVVSGDDGSTNKVFLFNTDSDNNVAGFSARGNVGIGQEGTFGRFKPDVVAPGAALISCSIPNLYYPSNFTSAEVNNFTFLILPAHSTNLFTVNIGGNATSLTISTFTNSRSGGPLPTIPIFARLDATPTVADFVGNNQVTIVPPTLAVGTMFYELGNSSSVALNIDLRTAVTVTNSSGTYYNVLSNLNSGLGGFYRYETGTSMSAAAVSGMLAMMEEYFAKNFSTTNSPALTKALLINGARSLGLLYNLQVNGVVNHQGWGLPNVTNSIPLTLTPGGGPVRFFEQNKTNALATGQSQTRQVTVAASGQAAPLRVTLVWTDPPGNPVTGVKLVNDLDLIVSNKVTGAVYVGNNFGEGSNFTQSSGTNATNITLISDLVNNVENVYIPGPLNGSYSITVSGKRVNVNSVNDHPDGVVQDYALVISSGDSSPANANPFTIVTDPINNYHPGAFVTPFATATNGIPLLNQRVGANSPLLVSANGATNQWNFFVFTNTTAFTNVTFVTFLPPNLSRPRFREADLDLYVTVNDPGLTNLNPISVAAADKSLGRYGTEFIVYSNSAIGTVYYIGVKSEDQQAANYGIFGTASEFPFNRRDPNGNQVLQCFPLPAEIPDGSPEQPQGVTVICLAMSDIVQKVVVTNTISHEEGGDLFGNLSHNERFAVLNDHRTFSGTETFVYDDSQQADRTNTIATDGPGSLNDFIGEQAEGVWLLTMSDNAQFHTGRVEALTIVISPNNSNDANGINIVRTIAPQTFVFTAINVPPDATNLQVCVSGISDPVQLFIRKDDFPTLTTFDYNITVNPPGLCVDISPGDSPPLSSGRWYIGVFNPNPNPVTARITATVSRNVNSGPLVTYYSGGTPNLLLDDAVTNSIIQVTNNLLVTALRVGVRIDHPRASDLVLHLVSPAGTRLLLMENRGNTNAAGIGTGSGTNIIYTGFTEDRNLATRPIKFARAPFTDQPAFLTPVIFDNGFEGPIPRYGYGTTSILSGWQVLSGTVDVVANGVGMFGPSYEGRNAIDMNGFESGHVYTNATGLIPGRDYIFSMAYTKNPFDIDTKTAQVSLIGANTNLVLSSSVANTLFDLQWSTTQILFRATSPTIGIDVISLNPGAGGLYVDAFRIQEPSSNQVSYFLAEEPLTPFLGENSFGDWKLEIWDNRAGGGLTNGQLVSWILQLSFPNTNRPVTTLTNQIAASNTVNGAGITYFLVNLPCASTIVTNTLVSLTGGQLDLLFNQSVLPTGTGPGDVVLLAGTTSGTSILTGGTPPLLLPGFFYLGVRNTDTNQSNSFTLRIDFDRTNCTVFTPLVSCQNIVTNIAAGTAMEYYQFSVQSNAVQVNFELLDPSGNVDLFVRRGMFPTSGSYDYLSASPGSSGELIALWTNSAPVPLTNDLWYIGVLNLDPTNVNYRIRVTEILPGNITLLANAVAFSNTLSSSCNVDYYRFTVSSNSVQARYEILAPSGNVDLYLRRGLPLPAGTNFDYASFNPGTSGELIVVLTNSPVALAPGDWYLAVVNPTNVPVSYAVRATEFAYPLPLGSCVGATTNLAPGTRLDYYTYQVSSNALQVNFELIGLSGNVDLLVQPGNFPTIGSFAYSSALSGTNAEFISVLTNSAPPLTNGLWYLGVFNRDPATVTYTVRVTEILASSITPLTNGLLYGRTVSAPCTENYYRFTVAPTLGQVQFEILGVPSGNVDLYVRRGLPLPSGASYDYRSVNPGTTDELITVRPGSAPVPLAAGDWYLAVVNQSGGSVSYSVRASQNVAPVLTLPPNTNINEQVLYTATATATDADLPANTLAFALVSGPAGLTVSLAGVISWTPTELQGPSTNTVVIRVTDDGVPPLSATNSFVITVNEVNTAPVLTMPPNTNINELVAFTATATATDADLPANNLTFALVSGPAGLSVSAAGVINWTPLESQGPSNYVVSIRVTDNGVPALSTTNSFVITVNEVNVAPVLTLPPNTNIKELIPYTANATATDADLPANSLTFALVSGPSGLTVSSAGVIDWIPNGSQGASTNTVVIRVTDDGVPPLSATNSYVITVSNVNVAPVLTLPPNTNINELVAFTATATATDPDVPTNALTFALVSGPAGLTVSPTGAINWTPDETQGGSTNTVVIRVTDDGVPPLSTTNSFVITVNEGNTAPVLTLPPSTNINELVAFTATATATDPDVPTNKLTFALVSGPTGLTVSTNGVIAWTPTELQGPSSNTVVIRVTDDGVPSLSTTNSFVITVNEVNTAPVLPVVADRTINFATAMTVINTATDSDLPANGLTYALVSPPAGAGIDLAGVITWTPSAAQAPSTNIFTTIVTDDGVPALSATNSFVVIVNPIVPPSNLTISVAANGYTLQWNAPSYESFQVQWTAGIAPPITWNTFTNVITSISGTFAFTDDGLQSGGLGGPRFYRLILVP